jgi:hypothetical protein
VSRLVGEDAIRVCISRWIDELIALHHQGHAIEFVRNDRRPGVLYLIAVASAEDAEPIQLQAMEAGA